MNITLHTFEQQREANHNYLHKSNIISTHFNELTNANFTLVRKKRKFNLNEDSCCAISHNKSGK
jgi:hypothetical protein